jgi:hypothetical protein
LGLVTATPFGSGSKSLYLMGALLIPKLRSQCAEFLNERSLIRLGILSLPTCVGLRYGQLTNFHRGFSWRHGVSEFAWHEAALPDEPRSSGPPDLPGGPSLARRRTLPMVRTPTLPRHPIGMTRISWCRNVDLLSIGYALRPGLRIRLTLRGLPFLRKP